MTSIDDVYCIAPDAFGGSELTRTETHIERLALRISLADIDDQFEKVIHKSLVFILRYLSKFEDHRKRV